MDVLRWQECQYKQLTTIDQLAIHFSLDGNMIHIDSDEAKRQLAQAASATDGTTHLSSLLTYLFHVLFLDPLLFDSFLSR